MAFTGPGSNQPPNGDPVFSVGVPSGAVMHFNLAACPTGWTALAAAQGRYLVGLPSAGTLAGTVGTALTNQENRATGQHSHGITDPGHTHPSGYGENNRIGGEPQSDHWEPNRPASGGTPSNSAVTGITINATGTVAGTNAPYIQFLVCQKN
ncbi:MAG: hypothetical protein D4Q79_00875 [Spirochaetia bacterium]|nr:MAG: hypothetical protein D4Q79_00875 [Spirochaetia bacterium]